MNRCETIIRGGLMLYLDDELLCSERAEFEEHFRNCEPCRSLMERERRFLEVVRRASPLHAASTQLRARIERSVSASKIAPAKRTRQRWRLERLIRQTTHAASHSLNFWSVAAISAMIACLLIIGIWQITSGRKEVLASGPSEFALMAADTHLRHLRGQLPLEVVSEAPQQISSWFNNKLSFSVELPNYQESSGQEELYKLEGGRLVGYKNDYAAYVAYQMRQRPISLVITSNAVARPSGGQEIVAKGLTFHYDSINGLKVITWSDRGLTYALVSDLEERGQQSCVVCHHGTKDQNFIESLKPSS